MRTVHAGLFEVLINVFVVQSRKELLDDGSHDVRKCHVFSSRQVLVLQYTI